MKHIIKVEVLENLPKTRPLIAMNANHNLIWKQDGTKIWYTTTDGEIYDLKNIIEIMLPSIEGTYNGPAVVSNVYNEEKQMWCMTFDDDVTVLGDIDINTLTVDGPFFATNPEFGLVCNIETIILPKTVTRIGVGTFIGCSGLTSIEIPNSVTSIGQSAFWGCTGLTSVTIPDSVNEIGFGPFYGCSNLTSPIYNKRIFIYLPISYSDSYIIPYGIEEIASYAFGENPVKSVIIPDSVKIIHDDAFSHSSLTSITIPNSVTSIYYWAFNGCASLTSVTIGNSVTSIGDFAFMDCTGLTSITCEATTPPSLDGASVFDNTNDYQIYVPVDSVEAYKAAEYWTEYATRIQAIQ